MMFDSHCHLDLAPLFQQATEQIQQNSTATTTTHNHQQPTKQQLLIERERRHKEPGWDANGSPVDDAFVKPEERVLDPSLLDKTLLERMPEPTGWRMLMIYVALQF